MDIYDCKTRAQLADYYGVSPRTFYSWIKRRRIKLSPGVITPKEIQIVIEEFGAKWGSAIS